MASGAVDSLELASSEGEENSDTMPRRRICGTTGRLSHADSTKMIPARLSRAGSRRSSLLSLPSMKARTSFYGRPGTMQRSLSSMGSTVAHYALLVVAENPVEQHKEYLERLEEEREADELLESVVAGSSASAESTSSQERLAAEHQSAIRERWQKAAMSIISSYQLVTNSQILHDKHAGGAERFSAVVVLERLLHDNPHKKLLMRTLQLKDISNTERVADFFINEVLLTGERIFDFFTPAEIGQHRIFFSIGMTCACFAVFYYMAGAYPLSMLQSKAAPNAAACFSAAASPKGRRLFVSWMFPQGAEWCFGGPKWVMGTSYLREWGARYGPFMRAQPSRWFTSWFVHQSFLHVTSNMALFLVVALQIEEKYGFWRIALLYFISALGGSFFSAAFEDGCRTVQGASGGVFGMMGLFIADLILNFETIKRPLLRGLLMAAFLVYFIVSAAAGAASTSVWSHVGGFLCGLFPSFLFLPKLRSEKWEQILPILGGFVLLSVFAALPTYFYRHRLPQLQCP